MDTPTILPLPEFRCRSGSVTAAGVLAIIVSGCLALLLLLMMVFADHPTPPFGRVFQWILWSMLMVLSVLGIATGLGLLNRRNWARVLAIVWAFTLISPNFDWNHPGTLVTGLLSVTIGLWWLILLARSSMDAEFSKPSQPRCPPAAISAIGWFLVISIIGVPLYLVLPLPFFIVGHGLYGWSGKVAFIIISLLEFAVGLALLRVKLSGVWLALGLQLFLFGNGLINDFSPTVQTALNLTASQILIKLGISVNELPSHGFGKSLSFVTPIVMAASLIIFWKKYLESSRSAT